MADIKDILLNSAGDLAIRGGDLVAALSEEQHLQHMLMTTRGDWKTDPLLGTDYPKLVKSANTMQNRDRLLGKINEQLEYDGWAGEVSAPNIYDITINAKKLP
jgi:hypothetical protein